LRATFANKNLSLTPGLFARIQLQGGGVQGGCLARDAAVITDLNQKYVLVLGKNDALEYRLVKLRPMTEGLRVVREGLHEGDIIVVSGLQRVRPGAAVTPKKVRMASQARTLGDTSNHSALVRQEDNSRQLKVRE
jgi:multidrug efflux pump subunit AcrA (membrane-fusion protein)